MSEKSRPFQDKQDALRDSLEARDKSGQAGATKRESPKRSFEAQDKYVEAGDELAKAPFETQGKAELAQAIVLR